MGHSGADVCAGHAHEVSVVNDLYFGLVANVCG